jgi:RNA polymerase sigma-70 factor (sigma-E family)
MQGWERQYVEYVSARLPALRRLGYHLCGDSDHSDDLVQETITSLYVQWRRIHAVDNLDGYVRRILLRAFLTERRRPWARVSLYDTPPERPAQAGDADLRMVLRGALLRIPPRQRAVLVLRFLHDLPVDEVAMEMRCSAGTVKSQTSHGLTALRRRLAESAYALH